MMNLWITIGGLLMVALVFIFWPLLAFSRRKEAQEHLGQKRDNVDIFKERLQELKNEKEEGLLDEASFHRLEAELEKSLLADVRNEEFSRVKEPVLEMRHLVVTGFISLFVIITSLGLYSVLGRSEDYSIRLAMIEQGGVDQNRPPSLEEAVAMLEAKLKENPDDLSKWVLLANSYSAMGQYSKAASTFARIEKQIGKNDPNFAAIKGAHAQALYQANGEQMNDEVMGAIEQALTIDKDEPSSLILLGIDKYKGGDYKKALGYWQLALRKAGKGQVEQFLNPAIASVQAKLGVPPETEVITATAKIPVQLDISPELKNQVNQDNIVFVFARPHGGRMPLAADRIKVKDLPLMVVLDDSKSVMPTAKLSSAEVVDITARVSLSGQPAAQPGDLFATIEQVEVGSVDQPIQLLIDQIVP